MKTLNFIKKYCLRNKFLKCEAMVVCILCIFSISNGQTTFTAGKYQLLLISDTYYNISGSDTVQVTTDHMLIKLRDDITENERFDFNSRYSITLYKTLKFGVTFYKINSGAYFIDLINELDSDPDVSLYDINHIGSTADVQKPNDGHDFIDDDIQWNHPNLLWPYTRTHLFDAWNLTAGKPDIIVANLDDGLWENHPDISFGTDNYSNLWANPGEIPGDTIDNDDNFKTDDIHGWNFPDDNNSLLTNIYPMKSHGTITSSIISAKTNNDLGIWGVAGGYENKGVQTLMLRISSEANPLEIETDFIPEAIDYAFEMGARIINMPIDLKVDNSIIHEYIRNYYNDENIVFLASAGNDNENNYLAYPAVYDEVIAVGATECDWFNVQANEGRWDYYAYGSNFGDGLDVVAPGGLFVSEVGFQNGQYYPTYTYKTTDVQYEFNVSTSRAVSFASGVVALMLSANPCLTNIEVAEILKSTATKLDGYSFDTIGFNEQIGFGRIDVLAALQPVIVDTITDTVTWSSDMKIYNDIIIKDEAVLTISNCTISLSEWVNIIVEPGSTLILDSATLTGICSTRTWKGIQVWGNRLASQATLPGYACAQGRLVIQNDAKIENAILAVDLMKTGDNNMTGGILEAHDAVFLNNTRSVHAKYYRNFNPLNPNEEFDYYGTFTNCSFILDENYLGDSIFYKHVDLDQVKGIKFHGCTFNLDQAAENVSDWSLGIAAYKAGFSVLPVCMSSTIPCEEYDSCRFSGFNWAIGVWAPGQLLDPTLLIRNAHFDNNSTGVYINEHDYAVILENFFETGYDDPYHGNCDFADGVGIDIHHSNGFAVENNKFRKNNLATSGNYAGIRVKNCLSVHDIIYKNEFDGLSYGNYAEGTNRSDPRDDITGVEYQCNFNFHNAVDFIVQFIGTDTAGAMIRGWHGDGSLASGNIFSRYTSSVLHFSNRGKNTINYYYCDPCTDEQPVNIFTWEPEYFEKEISNANNCPDHYGGGGHLLLTTEERLVKEEDFAQNLSDYNSVNYLYESLVDGGDTETELSEIESAEPDEMWELRSQLLGHSPHLSQEVLRAMAERTDVFPDDVLLEILTANPDELNRDTLISYLEQKEDPLPDYMIDILRQAISGITYKTILENEMAQYHAAKTQAAQDIIRSILFDTVFTIIDYRNWMDNMDNIVADRQIISSYLSENDTLSAITLLNLLPSLYELEGEELENYIHYKSLVEMQISYKIEGKLMNELDSADILYLETIALEEDSYVGNMARNILTYAGIHQYCDCLPFIDSSYLKNESVPTENIRPDNNILKISADPNPAHTYVAFNYELQSEKATGVINIADAQGKLIWQIQVNGKIGQKVWNTSGMKSGVYYYNLMSDGFSKAGKIVIY